MAPLVASYCNALSSKIISCIIQWVQHGLEIACAISHRTPVSNYDGTNCRRGNLLSDIIVRLLPFHVQTLEVAGVVLRKGLLYLTRGYGLEKSRLLPDSSPSLAASIYIAASPSLTV